MIDHISVVIITKNAAATLTATLESTRDFAEVVVWDNDSSDATQAIATGFANVAWHEGEFRGFGPSKNAAAACARNDWVLSLDSDEALTPELVEALTGWRDRDPQEVGEVLRENWFMGRPVRRAGWGGDYLVRLFHRGVHGFDAAEVHEKVALNATSSVQRLPGLIRHDAVRDIGQFLQKIDRYTELRRGARGRTWPAPVIVLKALFAFVRGYVFRLGFLAGWRGLVIAWSDANGVFYKYMKLLADRKLEKETKSNT